MWKVKIFLSQTLDDILRLFGVLLFLAVLVAPAVVLPIYLVNNDWSPTFVILTTLGVEIIWAITCLNFHDTFLV